MHQCSRFFNTARGAGRLLTLMVLAAIVLGFATPSQAGAADLITFTARSTTVGGGTMITAAVNLNANAPAGGARVRLRSSDSSVASVADSVTIAAGKRSALVKITTFAVAASSYPKITATLGSSRLRLDLKITPAALQWVSLPEEIPAGGTATGTVKLDGVAPRGGVVVALSSSKASLLKPPSTVKVPTGANSANFTVNASSTATITTVKVTAKLAKVAKSFSVTVVPPGVQSIDIKPLFIGEGQDGKGTVTLNAPAPAGGAAVLITPDNEAVKVPSSVMIGEGQTTATFKIVARAVSAQTRVSISASFGGVTRQAIVYVKVAPAKVTKVSVPEGAIVSGDSVKVKVELTGAATTPGLPVQLTSSAPEIFEVPASIMVPAGATSVRVTGTAAVVEGPVEVTITATGGGGTASVTFIVEPAPPPAEP